MAVATSERIFLGRASKLLKDRLHANWAAVSVTPTAAETWALMKNVSEVMTITQCARSRATGVADFARISAELTEKYRQFDEDDQSNGDGQPVADKHDAGQNLEEMSTGFAPPSQASGLSQVLCFCKNSACG